MTEPRELTREQIEKALFGLWHENPHPLNRRTLEFISQHDAALLQRLEQAEQNIKLTHGDIILRMTGLKIERDSKDELIAVLQNKLATAERERDEARRERDNLRLRIQAVDAEHAEMERQKHTSIAAFQALEQKIEHLKSQRTETYLAVERHQAVARGEE